MVSDPVLDIYVGSDRKVPHVADICAYSIRRHASIPVRIRKLDLGTLVDADLYHRDIDPLASTDFTYSRFLAPHLNGFSSLCMFCDNDFLFFADVAELVALIDRSKAVSCVHHDYTPTEKTKLDGQVQTVYPRKNWSSLMVFDGANEHVRNLTVEAVNTQTGAYLHRMQWVPDEAIGEIPVEWNWLEGHNEKPATGTPKAVHFTRGGPWFEDWKETDYADLWFEEQARWEAAGKPTVEAAR